VGEEETTLVAHSRAVSQQQDRAVAVAVPSNRGSARHCARWEPVPSLDLGRRASSGAEMLPRPQTAVASPPSTVAVIGAAAAAFGAAAAAVGAAAARVDPTPRRARAAGATVRQAALPVTLKALVSWSGWGRAATTVEGEAAPQAAAHARAWPRVGRRHARWQHDVPLQAPRQMVLGRRAPCLHPAWDPPLRRLASCACAEAEEGAAAGAPPGPDEPAPGGTSARARRDDPHARPPRVEIRRRCCLPQGRGCGAPALPLQGCDGAFRQDSGYAAVG